MKKILFIILFFVSVSAIAQRGNRERIKALKISFITERLSLTEKEAQEFWPVYNAFEQNMNAIRFKEMRNIRKDIREDLDTMTEEDASALVQRFRKAEREMYDLKNTFSEKLSKIISAKKIIQLRIAEDDFKRKMLDEFKKRRGSEKK